jgi:hypothetical protein
MEDDDKYIKVIKNFIDDEGIKSLISFIDSNINKFLSYQGNNRHVLRFGKDFYWDDSNKDFKDIGELEIYLRDKVFLKVQNLLKDIYQKEGLFVSNLWLSKHLPGSIIEMHEDIDGGRNPQFEYSAIIYLNSLDNTGILDFPFSNFSYTPVSGDLVIFPSKHIDFPHQFAHRVSEIKEIRYTIPMWISPQRYAL